MRGLLFAVGDVKVALAERIGKASGPDGKSQIVDGEFRRGRCDVDRMKTISVIFLLSLLLGAGSCSRMHASGSNANLLATGLVGWQQMGGQEGNWHFERGVLYTDGTGGWLSTTRQYGSFVLSLEFRVPPDGNSGVFIRAPHEGSPAYAGLEIQILDDYGQKWTGLQPDQYTGSIYDVQAPSEQVTGKAGTWQKMVVVARGPRIQVGVNGRKVIDTDVTYYADKLDTHPGLKRQRGYIGLQSHGGRVEFRNVRIRELPETAE
jgi:hypothetical protein